MNAEEQLARRRHMVISLLRLSGVGMVLLGVAIAEQAIELPRTIGYALAAAGVIDIFFVPQILARKWRTPGR